MTCSPYQTSPPSTQPSLQLQTDKPDPFTRLLIVVWTEKLVHTSLPQLKGQLYAS